MKNYTLSLNNVRNFLAFCISNDIYAYLSKPDAWGSPDTPGSQTQSIRNTYEDHSAAFFAKRFIDSDFSMVIRRIDWSSKVFDQYNNWADNPQDLDFYCMSGDYNVYKCLDNNGGAVSTVEPTGTNAARFTTADGYVWKYLFTVTSDQQLSHLTADWIPVKEVLTSEVGFENQYASQIGAVAGTVDRIEVIQGGTLYNPGQVTVTVEGDGSGATATCTITQGVITDISMTANGSGYTWAEVTVTDAGGSPGTGFIGRVILSPSRGHGFNPAEELYVSSLMGSKDIVGNEGGIITGDVDFRKFLVVANPRIDSINYATADRYDNTTDIAVSAPSGAFVHGETITGATGTAVVVYDDTTALRVTNVEGTFTATETITGSTSGSQATVDSVTAKPLVQSGDVIFRSYFAPRNKTAAENVKLAPLFRF